VIAKLTVIEECAPVTPKRGAPSEFRIVQYLWQTSRGGLRRLRLRRVVIIRRVRFETEVLARFTRTKARFRIPILFIILVWTHYSSFELWTETIGPLAGER
jgi:hypothetical protein